jgi:hypothetical protein
MVTWKISETAMSRLLHTYLLPLTGGVDEIQWLEVSLHDV